MTDFTIYDLYPKFLLNDRNGFAIAKAIEAGLRYFLERCQDGLDTLINVEKMPEWRLDEMAWEYNCLYDYNADIYAKRGWISNAYGYYRIHGTAEGMRQYLGRYFGDSRIIEWYEGDMSAGYFDVLVTGMWTDENDAWIRAAVEKAKNVRSILRNIIYNGSEDTITLLTGACVVGRRIQIESVMLE